MGSTPAIRGNPPPRRVLEAYGAVGEPLPLSGGQQRAWRVGDLALKPQDQSLDALRWQVDHLPEVAGRMPLRVAIPVATRLGDLAMHGWTAWPFLEGTHADRRWRDVIAVGDQFHASVRDLGRPAFLDARTDRWALADRYAWDELDARTLGPTDDIRRLTALTGPAQGGGAGQLIHGDLTGNVLFHPTLPPAVIDFVAYWRPAAFATAIVVADALVWEGAGPDLLYAVATEHPDIGRFVVRALLFRVVTDRLARIAYPQPSPYAAAIELAARLP
jgi:uncharacterized protein (TIGR02569 family)